MRSSRRSQFIKVVDDLGTPLLLNVNNLLAPQAYLRIISIGISDPMGYVISVILVSFSLFSMWVAFLALKGKEYATVQRGGGGLGKRTMKDWEKVVCYAIVIFILLLVLSPHIGLTLLSFATVWSFSVLPDGYTLAHYAEMFRESSEFITNTMLYAFLAAGIDVILGTAIAYLVLRTGLAGRQWLDYIAMAALAVPGVVLGIGFLRTFQGYSLPWSDQPLATWWVMLVIALSVRRLPYALRACFAGLQQVSVSLEEAAENLGAGKLKTVSRIVVPLMMGGILAGFVTSFATASVELSATIMLVDKESMAPISYGIYVFMQTAAGRGAGAAMGIVAVVIVALCAYFSHRVIERGRRERATEAMQEAVQF